MAKKNTKTTTKKSIEISNAQKLSIGVGLTAAAVTAAGAYLLYGSKEAANNRKKVKSWSLKAKAEVLEALENAQHITESEFKSLVDGVTDTYAKVQKLSKTEARDFKKEMVNNWEDLLKSGVVKVSAAKAVIDKVSPKKTPKKSTKKVTKKVTKKAVAKKSVPKKTIKTTKTTKKVAKK
ncbi:hypothetical protein KC845_03250 [Candidatus Kaiserbacteria bacterium]|nr:hypothetical protein [Candidatus Kaiserbacteria bacterium]